MMSTFKEADLLMYEQWGSFDLKTKDRSWQGCPSPRLDVALAPSNSRHPGY